MDIFNLFEFIGGISLFLFGMNVMSKALEKRAGGKLKKIVKKMTSNKFVGLLTGALVTAVIQSSSATTVMTVGFVNSGLMTLGQAIGVIMGANIGTTVTSWILSLSGISSSNFFVKLLKPSSFAPLLALVGVILYMFFKSDKKKDTGLILLGFATLMFGMETMSSSVSGLRDVDWFKNLFISFENNPFLGVLMGLGVTAIIQSSSASVGILQAFALTGQISFGAAIPIILGQNIGTCVTAIISSVGANKNSKRASLVHLLFNVIGTLIALIIYIVIWKAINPLVLSEPASLMGIALIHTAFNIGCTLLLFPFSKLLERLVCKIIPIKEEQTLAEIDDRLLSTPSIALEQVKEKVSEMCQEAGVSLVSSVSMFNEGYSVDVIKKAEDNTDHLEDVIGSYLIKLSKRALNDADSRTANLYLKIIGDLERIADHSLNIAKVNDEMKEKNIALSEKAMGELNVCFDALKEIWNITSSSLIDDNYQEAKKVEPLEQVIDFLVKKIRNNHIERMRNEECSIEKGFVLADMLTNIERMSDHCSNIASYIIDESNNNLKSHENIIAYRKKEEFQDLFDDYYKRYNDLIKAV